MSTAPEMLRDDESSSPLCTQSTGIHTTLDRACKYVVASFTTGVALWAVDWDGESLLVSLVTTMFALTGLAAKLLKRLLNHRRPQTAVKSDPGMPSTHAVALSYLSWAACGALLVQAGVIGGEGDAAGMRSKSLFGGGSVQRAVGMGAAAIALGLYWTYLRVRIGHHTFPQVTVGYALGCGSAIAVFCLNFLGCGGEHGSSCPRGGRVDALTTRTQRKWITASCAVFCFGVLLLATKKWFEEDFRGSTNRRSKNRADSAGETKRR